MEGAYSYQKLKDTRKHHNKKRLEEKMNKNWIKYSQEVQEGLWQYFEVFQFNYEKPIKFFCSKLLSYNYII